MPALTVAPDLSLARGAWAFFELRVAESLTFVSALFALRFTFLAATFSEQVFARSNALARDVADFVALVTALEQGATLLSTVDRSGLVAEYI